MSVTDRPSTGSGECNDGEAGCPGVAAGACTMSWDASTCTSLACAAGGFNAGGSGCEGACRRCRRLLHNVPRRLDGHSSHARR